MAYYMFSCCKGSIDNKLSLNEVSFLAYAAFIRGCIAFGLVQNIPEHIFPQKKVVVSSVLILVISSTMIIGSFTALFKAWVMPSPDTVASNGFMVKGYKPIEVDNIEDDDPNKSQYTIIEYTERATEARQRR
jgi:hypothetical protein